MVHEKKLLKDFIGALVEITDASNPEASKGSFHRLAIGVCSVLSIEGLVSAPDELREAVPTLMQNLVGMA